MGQVSRKYQKYFIKLVGGIGARVFNGVGVGFRGCNWDEYCQWGF